MKRKSMPIAWIGLIVVSMAFIAWYGWQTNIAPLQEGHHPDRQESQFSQQLAEPMPVPSEAEIKAQLEQNRQAVSKQPKSNEQKPQTPPQMPKPDPKREVMEYWWEQAPPKTKQ